eukprot:Blabericola_migrator_1__836@NODE_1206_length_5110_cov_47_888757_g818_i0_p1_GENE_NODE_1206_length_5110_cov_47_888757_g818_i0NODE_1206_length_5110_cov_47_888757_g818_i0_p1_ORF_typecomplete_len495_score62_41_NODE_1206_length_5110_cov_47_888757_g818_i0811565
MLGATTFLSSTISWLSSSTQLISGAFHLSERISQVLLPASSTFTVEERQILFLIQSYLLGILHPLKLCTLWSRHRASCILPLVLQVENILRTSMLFIHPILMGQRPIAAAHCIQARSQQQQYLMYNAKAKHPAAHSHPPPSTRQSEHRVRASLKDRLAECAERLAVALALLNTALNTLQVCDTLQYTNKTTPPICLATLLSAARRQREFEACTGTLMTLQGQLLLTTEESREKWHRIAKYAHCKIVRLTLAEPPEIRITWSDQHCKATTLKKLLGRRSIHFSMDSSLYMSRGYTDALCPLASTQVDDEASTAEDDETCKCMESFSFSPQPAQDVSISEPVDASESESSSNMFEHVGIDEGERLTSRKPRSHRATRSAADSEYAAAMASLLDLTGDNACVLIKRGALEHVLLEEANASKESVAMIFTTHSGGLENNTSSRVACKSLEFIYLARMLSLVTNQSLKHCATSEDWLDEINHETLVELLASASSSQLFF